MPKLPIVQYSRIIKALKHFGWRIGRQKGSHIILVKEGKRPIPIPRRKEINRPLLRSIIKESGVSIQEFLKYLLIFLFRR